MIPPYTETASRVARNGLTVLGSNRKHDAGASNGISWGLRVRIGMRGEEGNEKAGKVPSRRGVGVGLGGTSLIELHLAALATSNHPGLAVPIGQVAAVADDSLGKNVAREERIR